MSLKNAKLNEIYNGLAARNANEPEFLQAVLEVLESLEPVVEQRPELLEQGIGNRVIIQKDGKITDYDILEALTMQKGLDPYLLQVNDAINI